MKKRFFILLGLLIAAGAAYYFFSSNSKQETTYLTESVTRGNVEKTVVASGSVESVNEVDVGAQASGKITKLYVKLGQEIKKGEMIADIDSTTQINTLNTKKAALVSYQAQLKAKRTAYDVALSSYNRLSKLYTQKATSLDSLNTAKSTLDNAKAEMEAIEANIKQAEIEVNTAETNVGYTKITAPMDGTVISVPVSEGQTVNANQTTPTIVTIADLSKMKIKPEISEVLNNKNQPEPREVEIGVQNDFQSEIKSGLNEGEKVIVSQVANGEKVGSMPRGPRMF